MMIFTNSKDMSDKRCVLVQSKHDVMRIVDDVSTLMTLTSLYICNENNLGLNFTKSYAFLEVQHLYHCID